MKRITTTIIIIALSLLVIVPAVYQFFHASATQASFLNNQSRLVALNTQPSTSFPATFTGPIPPPPPSPAAPIIISPRSLIRALRSLLASGLPADIRAKLMGPKGDQGPQGIPGPMGPAGSSGTPGSAGPAGGTVINVPTAPSGSTGGSFGSFTNLSGDIISGRNLTVSGNATFNGASADQFTTRLLNVTGTCTGCSQWLNGANGSISYNGGNVTVGTTAPADAPANSLAVGGKVYSPNVSQVNHFRFPVPSQSLVRSVMATPPTTTFTSSHTIASPILWPSVTAASTGAPAMAEYVSYSRAGNPVIHGIVFPDYLYVHFTNVKYGASLNSDIYAVSFMHYGSAIELSFKGVTGTFMVKVNDQYISLTPQVTTNGGSTFYYIPFGSDALRRIDVIAYNVPWGGVYTAPTDTIAPAPIRGPRVVVVGDSITEGSSSNIVDSWSQQMADTLGWDDVWPSGIGGTGYLATGIYEKFGDRLATDVYPFNPDIVMFAGGLNDYALFSPAAIGAEALADFQAVRTNLPNAKIVVLSPFWHGGPAGLSPALLGARDAIKAAAQSVGATFLDVLEMPLPAGVTPSSGVLSASAGISATTISLASPGTVNIRGVIAFANGERYQVKQSSGLGPFTITLDFGLLTAHTSGETVTQVGDDLWTGYGRVGGLTGYGNSDVLVSADGTHPTVAGHAVLGNTIGRMLMSALK